MASDMERRLRKRQAASMRSRSRRRWWALLPLLAAVASYVLLGWPLGWVAGLPLAAVGLWILLMPQA